MTCMKNSVSKIKVQGDLKTAVTKAVDEIGPTSSPFARQLAGYGGTSLGASGLGKFIKKGDKVLLKPNFNTADPFPASTDFEFLKTVVELVYESGAKEIIIGDRSTYYLSGRGVMEKLGIFKLEKIFPGTHVIVLDEGKYVKKKIPRGRYLKSVDLSEILDQVDKLILLPCLKTHIKAGFTGSLKLSVGFMKVIQRIPLHLRHLQEKIAELNTIIHPSLIIMDGRKCFISGGPSTGEVREPGLILASTDRVAIDVEGIRVIQEFEGNDLTGLDPLGLPQIKKALELGIS